MSIWTLIQLLNILLKFPSETTVLESQSEIYQRMTSLNFFNFREIVLIYYTFAYFHELLFKDSCPIDLVFRSVHLVNQTSVCAATTSPTIAYVASLSYGAPLLLQHHSLMLHHVPRGTFP